jgi:phosphoserine aminotransferase
LTKVFNFSPGPSKLPQVVINKVEKAVKEFKKTGKSVLEISHRSPEFDELLNEINLNFEKLFHLPKDFNVLLLQGGATYQNTFVPMNIPKNLNLGCLVTGTWGRKTAEDYSKIFNNLDVFEPRDRELETYLDKEYSGFQNIDFLHLTSNETIEGLQIQNFNTINHKNLIIDMSSDLGSYNFNFHNLSYVYAGAQKNMGIPGVTICLVKEEFLTDSDNPKYLNLKLLAKSNSILNTPPTMSIFVLNLVTNWMLEMGGIDYFQNKAHEQSTEIYDFIDNNSDVLDCKVENKFRSKSNIVFNFLKDEHNKEFVKLATEKGIVGINGHRSVGGIRVSLFNSIDDHMFDYFMKYFKNYVIGIK